MTMFQRIKLWWLTSQAKSLYARWYRAEYGYDAVRSNYTLQLSHRTTTAEYAMNEYRRSLGLTPLWSYLGEWVPADGKSKGLNACSMTAEQYWAGVEHMKRLFG